MTPEERLTSLGFKLETPTAPMGSYVPVVMVGNLAFVSGHPPASGGVIRYQGRVGDAVSVEDGYEAARLCALNCLGALKAEVGELSRVERIVKTLGFVNCDRGFGDQPKVVNGASDLLVEVFGERGLHARAAVGVHALPADISVEVELIASVSS